MRASQGFTLIEMMIVVTIIGILASLAIPAYQDYIARAQVEEAINLAGGYKSMVAEAITFGDECPPDAMTASSGSYVDSVELLASGTTCQVIAEFKNSGVSIALQGKTLTLSMDRAANDSFLQWNCTSADIQQKYLPKTCTGT